MSRINKGRPGIVTVKGTVTDAKVKLRAPSADGDDRVVTVVYERKADYGKPSFLRRMGSH